MDQAGIDDLTKVEIEIMKVIWAQPDSMMMGQILECMNTKMAKPWKPQTMSTYLRRLVDKGFLQMRRQGKSYVYDVLVGKDDFFQKQMFDFTQTWEDTTPAGFVAAFSAGKPLSKQDKDELRKLIDDFD